MVRFRRLFRALGVLAAAAVLGGCTAGGSSSSAAPVITPQPPATVPATPPGAADRAEACAPSVSPGDTWVQFEAAGQQRRAFLHLPAQLPAGRVPALVALPGFSSAADEFARYTRLSGTADGSGFVVVYPEGLGSPHEWHLAGAPSYHPEFATSDHVFITAVVDWLAGSRCVDPKRILLAGHSMGGGMASEMACELSTKIAGVALVSAVAVRLPCKPLQAVPLAVFHALDDATLPYAGGHVKDTQSDYPDQLPVERVVDRWAEHYGCSGEPRKTALPDGTEQIDRTACAAPIRFFRLATGGHDWVPATNDRIWAFFAGFPGRNGAPTASGAG